VRLSVEGSGSCQVMADTGKARLRAWGSRLCWGYVGCLTTKIGACIWVSALCGMA